MTQCFMLQPVGLYTRLLSRNTSSFAQTLTCSQLWTPLNKTSRAFVVDIYGFRVHYEVLGFSTLFRAINYDQVSSALASAALACALLTTALFSIRSVLSRSLQSSVSALYRLLLATIRLLNCHVGLGVKLRWYQKFLTVNCIGIVVFM